MHAVDHPERIGMLELAMRYCVGCQELLAGATRHAIRQRCVHNMQPMTCNNKIPDTENNPGHRFYCNNQMKSSVSGIFRGSPF